MLEILLRDEKYFIWNFVIYCTTIADLLDKKKWNKSYSYLWFH